MKNTLSAIFLLLLATVTYSQEDTETHGKYALSSMKFLTEYGGSCFFLSSNVLFKDTVPLLKNTTGFIALGKDYTNNQLVTLSNDSIYFISYDGTIQNQNKLNVPQSLGLINKILVYDNNLYCATRRSLWVATNLSSGSELVQHNNEHIFSSRIIKKVFDIRVINNSIWLATDRGICLFEDGKFNFNLGDVPNLKDNTVLALIKDNGVIYAGGYGKIWRYDSNKDKSWVDLLAGNHLLAKNIGMVNDLAIDHEGALWIASNNLVKYEEGSFYPKIDNYKVSEIEATGANIVYYTNANYLNIRNTSAIRNNSTTTDTGRLRAYPDFHTVFILDISNSQNLSKTKTALVNLSRDFSENDYLTILDASGNRYLTTDGINNESIVNFVNDFYPNVSRKINSLNMAQTQLNEDNENEDSIKYNKYVERSIILITDNSESVDTEFLSQVADTFQRKYKLSVFSFGDKINSQERALQNIVWKTEHLEKQGNYALIEPEDNLEELLLADIQGKEIPDEDAQHVYFGVNYYHPLMTRVVDNSNVTLERNSPLNKFGLEITWFPPKFRKEKYEIGIGSGFYYTSFDNTLEIEYDSLEFSHTDPDEEEYKRILSYNDVRENQNFSFLEIPLFIRLNRSLFSDFNLTLDAGFQIALPLQKEYELEKGRFTYRGRYENFSHELRENIPSYGFLTDTAYSQPGRNLNNSISYYNLYAGLYLSYAPQHNWNLYAGLKYYYSFDNSLITNEKYIISPEYGTYKSMIYDENVFLDHSLGVIVGLNYRFRGKQERFREPEIGVKDPANKLDVDDEFYIAAYSSINYLTFDIEQLQDKNKNAIKNSFTPWVFSEGFEFITLREGLYLSLGVGYRQMQQKLTISNYYDEYETEDRDEEPYSRIITSEKISEEHLFRTLELPLTIGYIPDEGESFGPLFSISFIPAWTPESWHFYEARSEFSYKGRYPNFEHEIRENIPYYGFYTDTLVYKKESSFDKANFMWSINPTVGIYWPINKIWKVKIESFLSIGRFPNISEDNSENVYISTEPDHYISTFDILKYTRIQGGGIKFTLLYNINK